MALLLVVSVETIVSKVTSSCGAGSGAKTKPAQLWLGGFAVWACGHSLKRVHQQEGAGQPLVFVDEWYQALEVLGIAVRIQGGAVGPLFNENKVARVFLVDEELIGQAQRLLLGFFHQLTVQGHDDVYALRFDEVLGNDFEHAMGLSVWVC